MGFRIDKKERVIIINFKCNNGHYFTKTEPLK